MNDITLKFEYSIENEVSRVLNTLSQNNWLIDNGYDKWLNLPQGVNLRDDLSGISPESLSSIVEREYDEEKFQQADMGVSSQWKFISPKLKRYFDDSGLKPERLYVIKLTTYGTGGSYNPPDVVVVNLRTKDLISLVKTIVHEIIHLSIHPLILKYKIDHWEKERIVDLVVSNIMPDSIQMQTLPINTSDIDKVFNQHYPNMKEVIKRV